jgi:hypothetical protein
VIYCASEHIHLLTGAGTELAKGQHLFMTRMGVEYVHTLSRKWEVGASAVWDAKCSYYQSFRSTPSIQARAIGQQ